jgi:hypothetical protein
MLPLAFGVTIPCVHTSLTRLESNARSCHAALGTAVPGRRIVTITIHFNNPAFGTYLPSFYIHVPHFFVLSRRRKPGENSKEICEEQDWI